MCLLSTYNFPEIWPLEGRVLRKSVIRELRTSPEGRERGNRPRCGQAGYSARTHGYLLPSAPAMNIPRWNFSMIPFSKRYSDHIPRLCLLVLCIILADFHNFWICENKLYALGYLGVNTIKIGGSFLCWQLVAISCWKIVTIWLHHAKFAPRDPGVFCLGPLTQAKRKCRRRMVQTFCTGMIY